VANSVFLLQGVSSGQCAKPLARAPERGTTLPHVVLWRYACDQIASTPTDGAFGLVDESAERRCSARQNKRIRVFGVGEKGGLEHSESRRILGPGYEVDSPHDALAPRHVVVEGQYN